MRKTVPILVVLAQLFVVATAGSAQSQSEVTEGNPAAAAADTTQTGQAVVAPVVSQSPLEIDISLFEQKLFGETHEKETPPARMNRLEKFVYGAPTDGTPEARMINLKNMMRQKNPDGTMPPPPIVSPPPVVPAPDQGTGAAAAAAADSGLAIDIIKPVLQSNVQQAAPRPTSPSEPDPATMPPLHLSLGSVETKVDNPKRKLQLLSEAIQADPVFTADLFYQRAQIDIGSHDWKTALIDLGEAISKEPMRFKYYLVRACVYRKVGDTLAQDKDIATARYSNKYLPAQIEYDKDTDYERSSRN